MHQASSPRRSFRIVPKISSLLKAVAAASASMLISDCVIAQVSPDASMKTFKVADGLEVSLFASEPMFSNPTNIDVDAYGRVWVCEGVNYRSHAKLRPEGDR